jgi:hypothetical protein
MGDDLCVAEVQAWADGLAELHALIGRRFSRSEPRERVMEYVRGLLSAQERKNSWTLSEWAGEATPDGMQLTGTLIWSATTCSVTSLNTSRIRVGSWSSTRPVF